MPVFVYQDDAGHQYEQFVHAADDKACKTIICKLCQSTMSPILAFGQGLCYFEEGRARRIWNLEDAGQKDRHGNKIHAKPVYVTSPAQQQRLMRQQGVTNAGSGVGFKGQWV